MGGLLMKQNRDNQRCMTQIYKTKIDRSEEGKEWQKKQWSEHAECKRNNKKQIQAQITSNITPISD